MACQLLLDALLSRARGTHSENPSVAFRLLWRIRKWVVRFSDPLVRVPVGNRTLQAPFSHNLPVCLQLYPSYDRAIGRIAKTIAEQEDPLCVVDVGANIGDTASLIVESVPNAEILCV